MAASVAGADFEEKAMLSKCLCVTKSSQLIQQKDLHVTLRFCMTYCLLLTQVLHYHMVSIRSPSL